MYRTRHFWEYDELKWFLYGNIDDVVEYGVVPSGKFYYVRFEGAK